MKKASLFALVFSLFIFSTGCNYNTPQKDVDTNATKEKSTTEDTKKTTENPTSAKDVTAEKNTYTNSTYGYSTNYPAGWSYKETGGTYFSQAVGFNPANTSNEDYQVLIGVLSVDRQKYLDSLDSNSNIKIDKEFGDYLINGLPASKFVYKNSTTEKEFSVFTITSGSKTYIITADESVESTFLTSFKLK